MKQLSDDDCNLTLTYPIMPNALLGIALAFGYDKLNSAREKCVMS